MALLHFYSCSYHRRDIRTKPCRYSEVHNLHLYTANVKWNVHNRETRIVQCALSTSAIAKAEIGKCEVTLWCKRVIYPRVSRACTRAYYTAEFTIYGHCHCYSLQNTWMLFTSEHKQSWEDLAVRYSIDSWRLKVNLCGAGNPSWFIHYALVNDYDYHKDAVAFITRRTCA